MADPTATATAAGQPAPTGGFLNYQMSNYGVQPRRRQQQQSTPQQQQSQTPFMPNGMPAPAPAQPAPQPQQQLTPGTAGSTDAQGIYHAGTAPTATYIPQQIQQFSYQGNPQIAGQQAGLVQQILSNPQSMSPQMIAQMKGQNTDQAALLQRQNMGQLKNSLAARGINVNSGQGLGQQRQLMSDTAGQILNTNRGIDLQAASQNRQDLYNAANLADTFQNSGLQRAIGGYGAGLQGQQLQGQENQQGISSLYQQLAANQGMQQLQSQSTLGAGQNANQAQSIANQNSQFGQNFGLDVNKFDYQKQMDAQQMAAQQAAAGRAQSNWEDQMAFQYQQQQQNDWNSMLSYLMGGQ